MTASGLNRVQGLRPPARLMAVLNMTDDGGRPRCTAAPSTDAAALPGGVAALLLAPKRKRPSMAEPGGMGPRCDTMTALAAQGRCG